jgi:acetoin utilization deacetylase AcuC-like enzyme
MRGSAREEASSRTGSSAPGTGYIFDPLFLKHTQDGHPECAQRLEAILAELESSELRESLYPVPCRQATRAELSSVHTTEHIEHAERISRAGGGYFDGDTYATADSNEAALLAAGGLIELTKEVCAGKLRNGFALVRPPGHHATGERAMGFCIFNNVAVAARVAQIEGGQERVAIIDFDVHHGNGTEDVFVEDPSVLYLSTHQYPHYPGSGAPRNTGRGAGAGTVINLPFPAGVGDTGFQLAFTEIVIPALRRFHPQLLLVSAGYDAHWADPLAGLTLSLAGLAWISQSLVQCAAELCDGKIVFTLEGGYNLDVLAHGVANSIRALLGRDDFTDPLGTAPHGEQDLTDYLAEIKRMHFRTTD